MKQPKTIKFNGDTYTLKVDYEIDEKTGIGIGPLYERKPKAEGYLFMPDLAYLLGQTTVPTFMHPMKQRPESPATRSSRRRRN